MVADDWVGHILVLAPARSTVRRGVGARVGVALGVGAGLGEGVDDVMLSCGGLSDSRLDRASAVGLLVVRTNATVARFDTDAGGRLTLSRAPALAGPEDASTAGSQ